MRATIHVADGKKHDGHDCPSDLCFDSYCWQSANLAAQQKVGLLSHKRDKPDHTDSPHSVLDWTFGIEVDRTPFFQHAFSSPCALRF